MLQGGEYEVAEYLLNHGADPRIKPYRPRNACPSWQYLVFNHCNDSETMKKERVIFRLFEKGFLSWLNFEKSILNNPEFLKCKHSCGEGDATAILVDNGVDISEWFTSILCHALKTENQEILDSLYENSFRSHKSRFSAPSLCTLKLKDGCKFAIILMRSRPEIFFIVSKKLIDNTPKIEEPVDEYLVGWIIRWLCSIDNIEGFTEIAKRLQFVLENVDRSHGTTRWSCERFSVEWGESVCGTRFARSPRNGVPVEIFPMR